MKPNNTREEQLPPSNLEEYKKTKINELQDRLNDEIIIKNNFKKLKDIIEICQDKEQIDLVFSWGSENYQTGYYFNRLVENFRESARYLKKVDEINKGGENKLIIGDNYDALNNLLITHKNKIDIIYIDPPYGMDSEKEFAKTNYKNKIERDALLSMLEPRLEQAKKLLADEGVIFCSIDDKNQAHIKLLFDRVFGERNFVCNYTWVKKHGPGGDTSISNSIITNTEYILCYAKNIDETPFDIIKHDENNLKRLGYVNTDKFEKERGKYKLTPLFRPSSTGSFQYTPTLDYKIKAPDGTMFSLHVNKNGERNGCYTWGQDTYEEGNKLGFIECLKNKSGDWIAYRKQYQYVKFNPKTRKIEKIHAGSPFENIIDDYYSSEGGKNFTEIMMDKNLFTFPKPVNLIKHLIKTICNNDALILDFFAGSGTTAQAVLELNKEDNGQRKFILCVNNSGNSDQICKERLLRVMTGKDSKGKSDFDWIKKNKPLGSSLNIYEIKEASIHTDANCLLDVVNEEDYDLPKFKNKIKKIEWITENFKTTTKELK